MTNILKNKTNSDFSKELISKTNNELKYLTRFEEIKEERIKNNISEIKENIYKKIQEGIDINDSEIINDYLKETTLISVSLINETNKNIREVFNKNLSKIDKANEIKIICEDYLIEVCFKVSLYTLILDIESLRLLKFLIKKEEFFELMRNSKCQVKYSETEKILEIRKKQIQENVLENLIEEIYNSLGEKNE